MRNFLFFAGILLVILGIFLLLKVALGARKLDSLNGDKKITYSRKLVSMNMAGFGSGVFGLMMVFLSLKLFD